MHCSLADFQAKKGLRLVLVTGIVERNSDNGRYVKTFEEEVLKVTPVFAEKDYWVGRYIGT